MVLSLPVQAGTTTPNSGTPGKISDTHSIRILTPIGMASLSTHSAATWLLCTSAPFQQTPDYSSQHQKIQHSRCGQWHLTSSPLICPVIRMRCTQWTGRRTARESAVVERTRQSGSGKIRIPKMVFVTLKSQDTPEVIHNWFAAHSSAVHLKRAVCLCLDGVLSGRSEACLSGDMVLKRDIRMGGIARETSDSHPILLEVTPCFSVKRDLQQIMHARELVSSFWTCCAPICI